MLSNVNVWEVLVILLVVLLIFGGKRIPELARNLGKAVREFKKAKDDVEQELTRVGEPPAGKESAASQDPADAGKPGR